MTVKADYDRLKTGIIRADQGLAVDAAHRLSYCAARGRALLLRARLASILLTKSQMRPSSLRVHPIGPRRDLVGQKIVLK